MAPSMERVAIGVLGFVLALVVAELNKPLPSAHPPRCECECTDGVEEWKEDHKAERRTRIEGL